MTVHSPPIKSAQTETESRRLKMTYEEYLTWAGEDNLLAEWVDGEVIIHMPPIEIHQAVKIFLATLLNLFVSLSRLGRVLDAPFEMKLSPEGSAREPDILFVAEANLPRLTGQRLAGPADLAIEIISDDSVTRDREDKFYEYEAAGIPEYWIIDPRPHRRRAYFYQLDSRGQYQPVAIGADSVYRSQRLPGFWFNLEWLWGPELPNPLVKLIEIVGQDKYSELLSRAQAADTTEETPS